MECSKKSCQKSRKRKILVEFLKEKLRNSSQTSLLSNLDSLLCPLRLLVKQTRRKKMTHQRQSKHDYLTRLFEKKKLKDKFLSKEMKTPLDRKLNRSCWPIELHKVCKIKKKPIEKKKQKPTNKSLRERKFTSPNVFSKFDKCKMNYSNNCSDPSEPDIAYECFDRMMEKIDVKHFLYEPVTCEMLINVLQDPEHLKNGATLDTIISKLRALKLGLNPEVEMLKKEVLRKLQSAVNMGLIYENKGYFRVAVTVRINKLPRRKMDASWDRM